MPNILQIFSKYCPDIFKKCQWIVSILYKYCLDFIQILSYCYTDIDQILSKTFTKFPGYFPIIVKISPKYYRNIIEIYPDIVQVLSKTMSIFCSNILYILLWYYPIIPKKNSKFKILFQYNPYVLQLKSRHYVHCLSIVWICPNIVQILPK